MADDFEVKPMFEGQYHERPQFKVNIQGNDYMGVMHDDEIKWFHPHPHKDFEDEHVEAIESQIQDKLNNSEGLEVKPMFEGQYHERPQFKVNIQGNDYMGVMHDDEIKWFHPHPHKDFEDEHVEAIESQIQDKLNNSEGLEVKPMFEGQYHERPQFKVNIQGNDYMGVMHDDEIKWFHPHPHKDFEDEHVEAIESQIQDKLND